MIKLTVKKMSPGAKLPDRAHPEDAGLDLYAHLTPVGDSSAIVIKPNERQLIPTGLALEITPGYYGQIASRSGLAVKHGLIVIGGVIDSGYRGEVNVVLYNTSGHEHVIENGMKIAQLILLPCCYPHMVVGELSESARGHNGFGSSGV